MEDTTGQERPEIIGIGTPGTTDPSTRLLKNSNTICLNARPLQADLSQALKRETVLANDANCFALAEATLGAARDYPTAFGVIMGTGVGGGLVVNGEVLAGAHGIAGEWGHNVVDPKGEPCYCGQYGCVETIISGPALERHYASLAHARKPLAEIVEASRIGDDAAAAITMHRLIEWFGRSLALVINVFDPHAIVLGGGLGQIDELYSAGRVSTAQWVFNASSLAIPFLPPTLGDSAGVFGAAILSMHR